MVKATLFTSIAAATLCVVSAKTYHTKVAILGGGVSGISALLNLTDAGIDDFMVIEARDELGGEIYLFEIYDIHVYLSMYYIGRAQIAPFAGVNVELGCNWVQGLGSNPINQLALKYNLSTVHDDGDDVVFYDENGKLNNTDVYDHFNDVYDDMSDLACKFCPHPSFKNDYRSLKLYI